MCISAVSNNEDKQIVEELIIYPFKISKQLTYYKKSSTFPLKPFIEHKILAPLSVKGPKYLSRLLGMTSSVVSECIPRDV